MRPASAGSCWLRSSFSGSCAPDHGRRPASRRRAPARGGEPLLRLWRSGRELRAPAPRSRRARGAALEPGLAGRGDGELRASELLRRAGPFDVVWPTLARMRGDLGAHGLSCASVWSGGVGGGLRGARGRARRGLPGHRAAGGDCGVAPRSKAARVMHARYTTRPFLPVPARYRAPWIGFSNTSAITPGWPRAAAVAALLVLLYEIAPAQESSRAVSPQELIRLMNQGALVLDLRPPEQYRPVTSAARGR